MEIEQGWRWNFHRGTVGAIEGWGRGREIQPRGWQRRWRRRRCGGGEKLVARRQRQTRHSQTVHGPGIRDGMPSGADRHRRQTGLHARQGSRRDRGHRLFTGGDDRRHKRLSQCHAAGEHRHADEKPYGVHELRHVLSLAKRPRGHLDAGPRSQPQKAQPAKSGTSKKRNQQKAQPERVCAATSAAAGRSSPAAPSVSDPRPSGSALPAGSSSSFGHVRPTTAVSTSLSSGCGGRRWPPPAETAPAVRRCRSCCRCR